MNAPVLVSQGSITILLSLLTAAYGVGLGRTPVGFQGYIITLILLRFVVPTVLSYWLIKKVSDLTPDPFGVIAPVLHARDGPSLFYPLLQTTVCTNKCL